MHIGKVRQDHQSEYKQNSVSLSSQYDNLLNLFYFMRKQCFVLDVLKLKFIFYMQLLLQTENNNGFTWSLRILEQQEQTYGNFDKLITACFFHVIDLWIHGVLFVEELARMWEIVWGEGVKKHVTSIGYTILDVS